MKYGPQRRGGAEQMDLNTRVGSSPSFIAFSISPRLCASAALITFLS